MFNEAALITSLERAARHVVWRTPMEKVAARNGTFEVLGDFARPAEIECHGIAIGRNRAGDAIVEAYVHGAPPRVSLFRRALGLLMGVPSRLVIAVPSWGFQPYVGAGEPGAHFALAAAGGFGTIGGFAADLHSSAILAVSNNHVFANCDQAAVDDPLVDGASQQFGGLLRASPLAQHPVVNDLDGAAGWIMPDQAVDHLGIHGMRPPVLGLRVHKVGAASGYTTGTIVSTSAAASVGYGGPLGLVNFRRCLRIVGDRGPFSVPGDSGSLVLDRDGAVVGIVFAGDEIAGHSLANPIDVLSARLGIAF